MYQKFLHRFAEGMRPAQAAPGPALATPGSTKASCSIWRNGEVANRPGVAAFSAVPRVADGGKPGSMQISFEPFGESPCNSFASTRFEMVPE